MEPSGQRTNAGYLCDGVSESSLGLDGQIAASFRLSAAWTACWEAVHRVTAAERSATRVSVWPAVNSVLVVVLGLVLCRCFSVFLGERMVSVGEMSMVTCRFVGASLMVLRRFPMMSCGVLVMFGSFLMMLRAFMVGHFFPLPSKITRLRIARLFVSVFFNGITGRLIICFAGLENLPHATLRCKPYWSAGQ